MRRFLDWTANQTGGHMSAPNRRDSLQGSQQQQQQHLQRQPQYQQQQQQQQRASPSHQYQPTPNDPTRELEIQHLSKLLHEIKYYQASSSPLPSAACSQNQREFIDKIHRTLPLFLNVFGTSQSLVAAPTFSLGAESLATEQSNDAISHADSANSLSKPNSPLPPRSPQMDRFPDLLPFAFTIARLFVSEVRQRASNKHAEDASLSILQFLNFTSTPTSSVEHSSDVEMPPTPSEMSQVSATTAPIEDGQRGWNLLLSLNALALSQSSQIIQLLCDASLPSTLIKCLYLFFDLPVTTATSPTSTDKINRPESASNEPLDQVSPPMAEISSSAREKNTPSPLIRAFTQLLVQLCSNQSAIDELIKKDDLRLLIGISSSQCLRHNKLWRKVAFQTLLAISKNMRNNFMYLEQNLCIQNYVDNLNRIDSLGLVAIDEFIDMIKTLLEFLYNLDVNNRNQPRCISPLIEQFKASRIVDLIEELILKIDETIIQDCQDSMAVSGCTSGETDQNSYPPVSQQPSVSSESGQCTDEYRRYGRRMIQSLTTMAKINVSHDAMNNIITLKPLATSRFEMFEQFKMPRPSARNCILNYDTLRLLKMAWSKCRDSHIIEAILDATISLFNDDKYNYFIFESQQLLVYYMTSCNFKLFPYKVKQKLFKFLEFIIIETDYIPCLELGTLGTIIKQKSTSDADVILGLKTLIACLRFNSKFSDIFREIGLLEVIVELLIQTMQLDKLSLCGDKLEVLYLLLEASQYMLAGPNNLNCIQFNESGAARHVFNCLSKPEFFHLFVPAHSSSSDTENLLCSTPRTSTPPMSAYGKSRSQTSINYQQQQWLEPFARLQSKPSIKQLQKVAFTIIRQLILSSAGDEHLANLLGLLARNLNDLKDYEGNSIEPQDNESVFHEGPQQIDRAQPTKLDFTFLICQEVNLKICILKSLMIVLKDSHRCRTLFRKAGGFIYIVSSLVTLEKSLPSCGLAGEKELDAHQRWRKVNTRRIWRLIKNSLMTVVVAMRLEPANLRAFSDDVIVKFTEAIRGLGCFVSSQKSLTTTRDPSLPYHRGAQANITAGFESYKPIFLAPPSRDFSTIANDTVRPNEACCQLFRFLYDMSLNMGDGTAELESLLEQLGPFQKVVPIGTLDTKSVSFDQGTSNNESGILKRRSQLYMAPRTVHRPPSLDLNTKSTDTAILTFPCIVISILDLIPSCPSEDLMVFIGLVVKSLFKHERNQQLLCEAGMISKLLDLNWRIAITDKTHFLYEISEFMLEKLTKQTISAKELRMFLRLDDPMRCKNLDEIEMTESCDETKRKLQSETRAAQLSSNKDSPTIKSTKEKILTHRIEAFVSMMSDPRVRVQPPFVEFDMSTSDGFSSIFMPSISPVNAKSLPPNAHSFLNSTLDVHTNEKNGILGGVGAIERNFPPITGLTFSTWICIDRFPIRSSDASHNLRLLTIYRGSAATGKEYSCLRVQISALDRALIVSTQETLLLENENRPDANNDPDCNLRIWTPELLLEGKWHHIVVTINRSMMKQSRIHVYVDGILVHQQRICYIGNFVGATNSGPLGNSNSNNGQISPAAFVNAFIGSLPYLRLQLNTQWKQGPCHLLEEPLSASFVDVIYALGPNFAGNFQSSAKLNEIAKTRGTTQQVQYDLKYHRHQQQREGHKPLIYQQSTGAVHPMHNQSGQLARVASSGGNLSTTTGASGQQSSSQQFVLSEDRVLMALDARATSLMTLSRMRRIYTRFDCRQVSRVLGLALQENSTPILLLHNTGVHLNGPSRGIGAITIGHNHVRCFVPSPTESTLFSIGGCYILLGLIAQAQTTHAFSASLRSLVCALKHNTNLQAQMSQINGYQVMSVFFWRKKHLLTAATLKLTFSLITDTTRTYMHDNELLVRTIHQTDALRDLICECFDLWLQTDLINLVLEFIYDLISSNQLDQQANQLPVSNNIRVRNLKCLRDMDLLPRMLRLLPQYDSQVAADEGLTLEIGIKNLLDSSNGRAIVSSAPKSSFDAKAVYLIRQTVFELLNRTPRQSDILYFGQFLASLLPSSAQERPEHTIHLRNILLKSLLQMMTKNKQKEVNDAMQEELVRILGFDWFMLYISGSHLDTETITIGFLNIMIVLSNDELYQSFKSKSASNNGGWLKEPTFPTMDGKFNIQLLGMNVGVFFGLSGKRNSIKQEVLEAPNFYLLVNCLTNLIDLPRIYLMIFQTIMSRLTKLESNVLDAIEMFSDLNLDALCDCLVGDTHHKRRQTLAGIQFRCHELVVCIVYMLRDIMWRHESMLDTESSDTAFSMQTPSESISVSEENLKPDNLSSAVCEANQQPKCDGYPADLIRFLMYLYNNNVEFQNYCKKSDELIDALSETLMNPPDACAELLGSGGSRTIARSMTKHPASKEVLELSRLIILDTITDPTQCSTSELGSYEQLRSFERFLNSLSSCKEAQGELVDMLLRQTLLMIDSTARHNSIKTIGVSENVLQFQMLLVNSITISQLVVDKIWTHELYPQNLGRILFVIDHQLALAEQIFKFNELLPKHNPPHAFIIQRALNRILLFALSQPMSHMSDKMMILDLLKKIYDNRTIIILNHMHSPQSAEFFVCFVHCLTKIIETNSVSNDDYDQPASLIERQYGHPSLTGGSSNITGLSSSDLMLVSFARKVWDAIYQSKKGLLSEAFDVSLSLPAFTLETSLDLIQLKPDIAEVCEKCWSNFMESEQKMPKKRLQQRSGQGADSGSAPTANSSSSSAVNILSGRLTRVVNAANFVSRVVGATAGSMASNVNLVGEKLSQSARTSRGRSELANSRSSSDTSNPVSSEAVGNNSGGQQSGGSLQPSSYATDQSDLFVYLGLSKTQIVNATRIHISIIEDYIDSQLSQKNHKLALHKYVCDEWLDTEYEVLLRERALFGPDYGSQLDKWCLDMTEGPRRMRKKMFNNSKQFYEHYQYRPEQYNPDNKSLRYRPPMSYDSHPYYMKTLNLDDQLLDSIDGCQSVPASANLDSRATLSSQTPDDSSKISRQGDTQSLQEAAPETGEILAESVEGNIVANTNLQQSPAVNVDSPSKSSISKSAGDERLSSNESLTSANSNNFALGTNSTKKVTSSDSIPANPPSELDPDDGDSTSFVDFSPEIEAETNSARESENVDSLSVLRLLERNERISHMFRCSRVQGLDTYEGLLLFGREHFYLIDGFTLLKTREIKDIDSLPADAHDPIIPNSTPNILAHSKKTCAKFSFDSVLEVHKRRYLLQPIALEVFSSDGRNSLIVFPRNIRNKVYSRLMTVATQITSNAHESLAGQKSNVSVEGGSGLLSNLIGETSVTQRWVRGELSNFQYLMNLNTIAGRSYNDLMQYPIFPWILADYSSDYLDLNKPSTFRDLSRPIGGQTSERLEQFKRRYADWDDTETPPYHYGTFYSSAMIVASYMVRMEPFTQHFLRLQGGHFDLADRMFHSIHDSWLSASKHNMADIKELIPEFFYLPEFLKNDNKFDLGIKQNGMKLDDVILPPWAKNDAREFIRLHRCALESDYVSAHLHEWIDLIFGCKQQGQAAVDAVNVFHHLFYEGNVDIYNTDIDPIKKNAVIGFINNFGQVPKQLFKKSHPARKVTASNYYSGGQSSMPLTPILPTLGVASSSNHSNQRILTHCPQMLRQSNATFKDLRGPVGQIVQIDKNIVAVEQNKYLIPPEYCRFVAWGHPDRSLRLGLYDSERPIFVWEGSYSLSPSEILCCTIPNNRTMITAGTDSLITVWKIDKMKSFSPMMHLYGHVEPVTCLASSQAYSLIVSGSRDHTAIIWDLNKFTFVRQLGASSSLAPIHRGPISAIAINDSTGDIVTCASSWLYLWTINGQLLAQIDTASAVMQQPMGGSGGTVGGQLHILSVCFSQFNEWDSDEVILTGSSDGSVAIWSTRFYQCPLVGIDSEEGKGDTSKNERQMEKEVEPDTPISIENETNAGYLEGDQKPIEALEQRPVSSQLDGASEQEADQLTFRTNNVHQSSEPINIKRRQRTDTMNSDWVRLSASSTSTIENMSVPRETPTSLDLVGSADSCGRTSDSAMINYSNNLDGNSSDTVLNDNQALRSPLCSTPVPALITQVANGSIDGNKDRPQQEEQLDLSIVSNIQASSEQQSARVDEFEGQSSSKANLYLTPNDPSLIKFSKSDTSLVDSFVILGGDTSPNAAGSSNKAQSATKHQSTRARPQSSTGSHPAGGSQRRIKIGGHGDKSTSSADRPRNACKLLPDHCWKRQLYLRTLLSRRNGKTVPSAVTSLAISKDHRTVYVGDLAGRISSWSTTAA